MFPKKARFVAVLFIILFFTLLGELVWLVPWTLPWVLGAFALPGAWKFCRTLYVWMQDPGEDPRKKDEGLQ